MMTFNEFYQLYKQAPQEIQQAVSEIIELQENCTLADVKRITDKYGITGLSHKIKGA